ncbi:MAG: right-handed parallel beta-helix repeat-containing protein [Verrucomicrobia bacterium]|nr:right-handed parallel beta-helix repeat-containing protein [Verrucomicrobiota bacterium]
MTLQTRPSRLDAALRGRLALFSVFFGALSLQAQQNLVVFDSPPGDFIGGGQTYLTTDPSQVRVSGNAAAFTVDAFGFGFWFDGPGGDPLAPGSYPNAIRTPLNGELPGLSISGNGRGCNTVAASFEILELEETGGEITRLWVKYRHSCEGSMPAGVGEIRINSATAPEQPEARTLRVPSEYPTLAAAVEEAAFAGDTILVAPGTYREPLNLRGKRVIVRSSDGPGVTEIVGSPAAPILTVAGGQDSSARVEGFTLRDGSGGGVHLSQSSAVLAGNVITNCSYGVMVFGGSPVIVSNRIVGAYGLPVFGLGNGSGVHLQGAGRPEILDNLIAGGMAGITCWAAGTPLIRGNWIQNNQGDGISHSSSSDTDILQNVISRNQGNGISWLVPFGNRGPRVIFNTLVDNVGFGIHADGYDGAAEIINNLIIGTSGLFSGTLNDLNLPVIRNNQVYSPSGSAYAGSAPDLTGQQGNIGGTPRFLGAEDYRPQADTPGTDRGLPLQDLATDLDGQNRAVDASTGLAGLPDIGAFEYLPQPPRPPAPLSIRSTADGALLEWPAFDAAGGYLVFRAPSDSAPSELLGSTRELQFEDRNVTAGTIYWYSVAGTNRWGAGGPGPRRSVRAANRTPLVADDELVMNEDSEGVLELLGNDTDPDGDPLTLTVLDTPPDLLLTSAPSQLSVHPRADWSGTNSFRYRVEDLYGAAATGEVRVVVLPVNDAPRLFPRNYFVETLGRPAVLPLLGSDVDGDPLTVEVVVQGAYGRVGAVPGRLELAYQPAHGFSGPDVVAVRVTDGRLVSEPVQLRLDVRPPLDRDGDNMADAWEELWDLNNPLGDRDLDGQSNRDEYLALTSPIDATSRLVMDMPEVTPEGYLRVGWPSVGGVRYRLEVSEGGEPFVDLERPLGLELDAAPYGASSRQIYLELRPLTEGVARLYRIRVLAIQP